MAARSGITITGGVVREGDLFEYELGWAAFVRHVPKLGSKGRIVGAYASATAKDRPAVVSVLVYRGVLSPSIPIRSLSMPQRVQVAVTSNQPSPSARARPCG